LDHGRLRGPHRSIADAETIDLGHEPPLSVDGGTSGMIDRRRVSAQWFSGTILTGICGAALMGGAVFASLDGETNFASVPVKVSNVLHSAINTISDKLAITHKGDRLPPASEYTSARQVIRDTRPVRVGDREIMRVHAFVRVAANLTLIPSELTASIPPLNPQKFMNAAADVPTDQQPGAEPDAEVSFVTRDLSTALPRMKVVTALPLDDIVARVRETAHWTGNPPATNPTAASPPAAAMAYANNPRNDPYAGFETRIVPENVTLLSKTASQVTGGNAWNERIVTVKKGDTVSSILRDLGATPEEITQIVATLGPHGRDGALKDGQKLRIQIATAPDAPRMQPVRVMVMGDSGAEAVVALSDKGKYVQVDVASVNADVPETTDEDDGRGIRLYQSIYETALRNHVPRPVIESLIQIYSYDVDFQHKAQPGDSFDVLYTGDDENIPGAKADVLFASLSVGGEIKKFYRFQTSDDSIVDYYDETGKSAKKFLVRKPVPIGIMRSGFGARHHPLLGYMRAHTGVDWAAPLGTPIFASGNGVIEKVGWESGYGKYIRIRHAYGYETAYGHMTAFARGIQPGVRVHQGQIIGYVGSTGLSTGPHVHYEILVNGRFVDPLRLKLPRGRVLDGPMLAGFDQERERIDAILQRSGARLAQTAATPVR
jgi:murein DD-endopeptidase MepM/ murein hydrolase activator NlpD